MDRLRNARILLVNDDGIDAPGMAVLERALREFSDDIWVVAPDEERSGAGHSLSITLPVRLHKRDNRHYAVKGTPTDCVLLAVHELMTDKRPDWVISGINRGPNLAEDVTYSGTIAAAMEGALLGIPAVALSQNMMFGQPVKWDTAAEYTPRILQYLLDMTWSPGCFINVNFPDVAVADVTGVRSTRQGRRPPGAFLPERRVDGRDVPYYWIKLDFKAGERQPGTDLEAIHDGAVSMTPMHVDLTAYDLHAELERALGTLASG